MWYKGHKYKYYVNMFFFLNNNKINTTIVGPAIEKALNLARIIVRKGWEFSSIPAWQKPRSKAWDP